MHEKLVKRLRNAAQWADKGLVITPSVCLEAADAVEELIAKLNHADDQIERLVEAAEERHWIPVEERLPQGGDDSGQLCENVLLQMSVEYNDNYVTSGWINGVTKKVYYLDEKDDFIHRADMSVVKAWMPLPEPPKEE